MPNYKAIPNFPGYYANRNGDIWSILSQKILRPRVHRHKNGYITSLTVVLATAKKRRNVKSIASLVLLAFRGYPAPGEESCHRDGNPTNNQLKNLRWGSHKSNMRDCINHGRFHYEAGRLKGSTHTKAKLNEFLVRRARQLRVEGLTYREISRRLQTRTSWQTLAKAIKGEKWRHVA